MADTIDNLETLQRLSSLEAILKMHVEQDTETFKELKQMHKTHFDIANLQGARIERILESMSSASDSASKAREESAHLRKRIEEHLSDHNAFYVKILSGIILALITVFISMKLR